MHCMTVLHVSGITSAVAYVLPRIVLIVALSGHRPTDEMTDVRLDNLGSSFRFVYPYFGMAPAKQHEQPC